MNADAVFSYMLRNAERGQDGVYFLKLSDGGHAEWYMDAWAEVYNAAGTFVESFESDSSPVDGDYVSALDLLTEYLANNNLITA